MAAISKEQLASLGHDIIEAGLELVRLGLVPMTQGNLSMRDPESGHILITPHDYSTNPS